MFTYTGFSPSLSAKAATATQTVSNAASAQPEITAETAIVADVDSGRIYYQKNMHEQMYPASITKILTGILAVEKGQPQDVITIPADIMSGMPSDSQSIGLTGGEQITQDEAMYTMFVHSANDSANALALHIGGTIPNFVNMMNAQAKELGAVDSHFDNANGLPDKNNVTSAYDMAIITRKALETPTLMKYFSAKSYVMPATNKDPDTRSFQALQKMMTNTVYHYDGTIAGKTGWETMSGHTMVTAAKRNGRTLVCIVMKSSGASTVYTDTISLLNYCFALPADAGAADYLKIPAPAVSAPAPAAAAAPSSSPAPAPKVVNAPVEDSGAYLAPLLLFGCAACLLLLLMALSHKNRRAARNRMRRRSTRVE